MSPIRLGTCSWKYESWEGLVYSNPRGKGSDAITDPNYLKEYSGKYDTVEVDQWFWSLFKSDKPVLPDRNVVLEYAKSVPDHFRFTVKVPNSITLTHHYAHGNNADLNPNPHFLSQIVFRDFLDRLEPMHRFLGPLLFQFEYLNRKKMKSQAEMQARLDLFFHQLDCPFPKAIEIRNQNYLNQAYFDFLLSHDLGHVLLQGYWMPSIIELLSRHRDFFKKQKIQVIRLHGGDRGDMEKRAKKKWDKIVESRRDEIRDLMRSIQDSFDDKTDLYLNVNNHYEGSAPLTISTIRDILSGQR